MEEREIIKSNMSYLKKLKRWFLVIVGIVVLWWVCFSAADNRFYLKEHSRFLGQLSEKIYKSYNHFFRTDLYNTFDSVQPSGYIVLALTALALLLTVYFFYCSKMNLTVTNKRIYGKTAFGRRVDLPLDMISAVGTRAFKGITVSTSSGIIKFLGISNQEEVHKAITDLLMDRQNNPTATTQIKQEIQQSNADELGKFKALLDKGIITQEEFDAKKKQLLGL